MEKLEYKIVGFEHETQSHFKDIGTEIERIQEGGRSLLIRLDAHVGSTHDLNRFKVELLGLLDLGLNHLLMDKLKEIAAGWDTIADWVGQ